MAVFLLFAAVLLSVTPAEASIPRAGVASEASASFQIHEYSLAASALTPCWFTFAEGVSLIDAEHAPRAFSLIGSETSRCERTYVRNNPLKYVDPDGKEPKKPSTLSIIWAGFTHFVQRHVRKDTFQHKSKFLTNDPERAKALIERTLASPDKVTSQLRNGIERKVAEKEFNKVVGTDGETIVRAVTEEKAPSVEKLKTAFPVKDFLLSLIPGVAEALVAKEVADTASDAAKAGADRLGETIEQGNIGEHVRNTQKADCISGEGPCRGQ